MNKFKDIDDAHTFEYYLDRVLFRGLYPTLPQVILDDMHIYEQHGIESHITLQVGTAFVPELVMHNLPIFAQGMWDDKLSAETYITAISQKILPAQPKVWENYFTTRAKVYSEVMKWCDHDMQGWYDYRWIPETTLPYGKKMMQVYEKGSATLSTLVDDLEKAISPQWSDRVQNFAKTEITRTRFEVAEIKTMMSQQAAANYIGEYLNVESDQSLQQGIELLKQTLQNFEISLQKAREAGIKDGDYYYMYNDWITKEIRQKIIKWQE
jgi:hypothetical protein